MKKCCCAVSWLHCVYGNVTLEFEEYQVCLFCTEFGTVQTLRDFVCITM